MLGPIEVMLKRKMDATEFNRKRVKAEIMAISDPEKSETIAASRRPRSSQKRKRNNGNEKKPRRSDRRRNLPKRISGFI